ncbi:cystine ABC transporter substrate-binding lipoprotein [Listeria floridensis FSL S10-1187]|uniref:Cystine ABC transporter substrate-binding lipoprotein n=1 Tax=Listeria floridensis FSL S10-1187 TaxID=1265817 RepID=A0ABN0RE74_9LIST|nr:amino acid ABC transporter substrate-binding protein [Listeria floridensis]EUJ30758.1 cystine ABC transporter substrate-binding lipoprotein [Listeria floridensis FSL S10-1187]
MKKILALLLTSVIAVVLAACSSGDSSSSKENEMTKIEKSGTITVGTEGTYRPFTFHDEDTNKLTGFDVDVVTEIAKRLDLKVKFEETQWDSMFAGLNASRFDVIANQVGINSEREKKYDLSEPYSTSTAVIVTAKDNDKIKTMADLKGVKVAQSLTSNYGKIAQEAGADIQSVDGLSQSLTLIKQGRIDATVNDKLAVLDYMKETGDTSVKIAAELDKETSSSAFAFRKDTGIKAKFDKELTAMKKDGTLKKISEKWFGQDVSK